MNRICFHNEEDGTLQTYWEEVTLVDREKAGTFVLKGKPAYLQMFFHRPLDEEEIRLLYSKLREHKVIDITDEMCDSNIEEDIMHQPMGTWEFKCDYFTDLFNCACDISQLDLARDGSITFQIVDEPSNAMRQWLEDKNAIKKIASSLKNLVAKNKYVDVSPGVEKYYGVNREQFNNALKILKDKGYHVTVINYKDRDQPFRVKILSLDVLCPNEIRSNKERWKAGRKG